MLAATGRTRCDPRLRADLHTQASTGEAHNSASVYAFGAATAAFRVENVASSAPRRHRTLRLHPG